MSWMSSGHRPQRCPLTNMSMPERRRQVAILRQALRRAVIDPKGMEALKALVPELGPDGVEPDFDG